MPESTKSYTKSQPIGFLSLTFALFILLSVTLTQSTP